MIFKMSLIFINGEMSRGPEDWKKLHPEVHWKKGRSARALAYSWEEDQQDFPRRIKQVFKSSDIPGYDEIKPLVIIPEYEVNVPGRGKASTNDIFVLAEAVGFLVSIMVEGKVDEGFAEPVSTWRNGTANREKRLTGICNLLQLKINQVKDIPYQLLHRSASAIIEAKRYKAPMALMIVQSFDTKTPQSGFNKFAEFAALYDRHAKENELIRIPIGGVLTFLAWIKGDPKFLCA